MGLCVRLCVFISLLFDRINNGMQIVIGSRFFPVLFKYHHCKLLRSEHDTWCSVLEREWLPKENHPEVTVSFDWGRNKNSQPERTAAEGQHLFYFFRNHF